MKRVVVIGLCVVLNLIYGGYYVVAAGVSQAAVEIVEANPSGLVIEVAVDSAQILPVLEDGQTVYSVSIDGYSHTSELGKPRLPSGGTVVGVPFSGQIGLRVLDVKYHENSGYKIEVVESIADADDQHSAATLVYEESVLDAWYPKDFAELGVVGFVRDQRIAQIVLYPVLYHQKLRRMRIASKIRVEVTFGSGAAVTADLSRRLSPQDSVFESYFRRNLANYTQAKQWRSKVATGQTMAKSTTYGSEGPMFKVVVEDDGFYQITGSDLMEAGAHLASIDPSTIRMTNKEREVPLWITGDRDGSFDEEDAIRFFGQFNRGDYTYYSPYTPSNVYWLSWGGSNGLRIVEVDGGLYDTNPTVFSSSRCTKHFEVDNTFERLKEVPDENVDHWFWKQLKPGPATDIDLTLEDPASTSAKARVQIQFRGLTHPSLVSPDHHVIATLNGYLLGDIAWDGQTLCAIDNPDVPNSVLLDGQNVLSLELPGDTGAGDVDLVYLDWIEIVYEREYKAVDNHHEFDRRSIEGNLPTQFTVYGFSRNDIIVLDTHGRRVANITKEKNGDSYTLIFQDNSPIETTYYMFPADQFQKPKAILADDISQLRSTANRADYIVITHSDFLSSANRLADFRRAQGLLTMVVDVQDIYDEFSAGSLDPRAIKRFLQYAYTYWTPPSPTYVLLIGDCTYGYDKRVARDWGIPTYMPTMMEYTGYWGILSSDNYFVCVSGDDILPDMCIGRLPVSTSDEAGSVVAKIVQYAQNPIIGEWRRRLALITGTGSSFETNADRLEETCIPPEIVVSRLSTDTKSKYMGSTEDLVRLIDEGAILLNFIGHGGGGVFSDEALFEIDDVALLNNSMKFPVLFSLTCFIGYFDSPTKASLGEELLRATGKGVVAHFGCAGKARVGGDQYLNTAMFESIFENGQRRMGQITTEGKLGLLEVGIRYADEAKGFNLLGDPAMELGLPPLEVVLESQPSSVGPGENLSVTGSVDGAVDGWVKLEVLTDRDSLLIEKTVAVQEGHFQTDLLRITDFTLGAWPSGEGEGIVRAYYWGNRVDGMGATSFSVNRPHVFDVFTEPSAPAHMDSIYIYAKASVSSLLDPSGINELQCLWSLNTASWTILEMNDLGAGVFRTTEPLQMEGGTQVYYKIAAEYGDLSPQEFKSAIYSFKVSDRADILFREGSLRIGGTSETSLDFDIQNDGGSDTGPFAVQIYDGDPATGGTRIGDNILLTNLPADTDTTLRIVWAAASAGKHSLYLIADPDNVVSEKQESNNVLQKTAFVLTAEAGTGGWIGSDEGDFEMDVPPGSISSNCTIQVQKIPIEEFYPTTDNSVDLVSMKLRSDTVGCVYSVTSDDTSMRFSKPYRLRFYFDVHDSLTAQATAFDKLKLYVWDYQAKVWVYVDSQINQENGIVEGTTSAPLTTYGIFVNMDNSAPSIALKFEGQNFANGDYVSSKPRITATIEDQSPIDIAFHPVSVRLDGQELNAADFVYSADQDSKNMGLVSLSPSLSFGEHHLKISAYDVHGNVGTEVVDFTVSDEFALQSIANHPNPFSTETVIAFTLTTEVDNVDVRIYTTSGRLIRDLSPEVQTLGFYTEVVWDGTDDNGDEVANGVYYLKLAAEKGDERIETIEKMARIR